MLSGTVYQLPPSAPLTGGTGSGLLPTPTSTANQLAPSMQKHAGCRLLWPTPTTQDWKDGSAQACQNVPANGLLGRVVHQFTTPQSRDFRTGQRERWENPERSRNLNDQIGGSLNPTWVEWLMGFPTGHTDLKPSEMP
jgi:hypothetical protein